MCWFNKNKKNDPVEKDHEAPFIPEEKTIQIMWEVTVINNVTDKEIIYTSTNVFGLHFKSEDKEMALRQNRDINQNSWSLIGYFTDWSIKNIDWKEARVKTLEKGGYELIEE